MSHYNTLGIPKTSSMDDIKKAYRKLARIHHPDKGGDEDKFKKITDAYEILSDPVKKRKYDNPVPVNRGFRIHVNQPWQVNRNVQRHVNIQMRGDEQIHTTVEKIGNQTITTTIIKNNKTGQVKTVKNIHIST